MTDSDQDHQSFEALLRPHLERLYRLAYRLTGAVADAEDLVQDVLIKAYGRRAELTSIAALAPWLSRVLYNQFVDNTRRYARDRLRAVPLDQQGAVGATGIVVATSAPAPDAEAELGFDIRRLREALAKLSLEHRAVLLMHDSEGYKLEEIHTITGTPVGTLKSRLHRARARLRELLEAHGTF